MAQGPAWVLLRRGSRFRARDFESQGRRTCPVRGQLPLVADGEANAPQNSDQSPLIRRRAGNAALPCGDCCGGNDVQGGVILLSQVHPKPAPASAHRRRAWALGQDARLHAKTSTHRPARRTAAPRAARQQPPPLLLRAHRLHALPRRTARRRIAKQLCRTRLCVDDPPRASTADTRCYRLHQRHDASLGRRYVRCINDRYRRTGTLWEGRFQACPVQSDDHLLRC